MLALSLLWVGAAHAARVTEAQLGVWLQQEAAQVEALTGTKFLELPTLEVVSASEARARIGGAPPSGGAVRLDPDLEHQIARAVMLYSGQTQHVLLLQGNVEVLFARFDASQSAFEAALRHVITHELTHALQDQHQPHRPLEPGRADLDEGFATLVADRLERNPAISSLLRVIEGTDALSSADPADDQAMDYGFGFRYLDLVERGSGWPAVWYAVAHPPTETALMAAIAPTLEAAWADPAPLKAAVEALLPGARQRVPNRTSAGVWLGGLEGGTAEQAWAFGGDGGLVVHGTSDWKEVAAGVIHVDDRAAAERWLDARARQFNAGRWRTVVGGSRRYEAVWVGALRFSPVLGPTLRIRAAAAHQDELALGERRCPRGVACVLRELWALRGSVLATVAIFDRPGPWGALEAAIPPLWSAYPAERPAREEWPTIEVTGASQADAVVSGSWLRQWAEGRLRRAQPCRAGLERWGPAVASDEQALLADVTARCAR